MSTKLTVLDSTGKKPALSSIAREFVDGQLHSYPPDVIYVIGVPGPSLFLLLLFFIYFFIIYFIAILLLPCNIYTECKPKN